MNRAANDNSARRSLNMLGQLYVLAALAVFVAALIGVKP